MFSLAWSLRKDRNGDGVRASGDENVQKIIGRMKRLSAVKKEEVVVPAGRKKKVVIVRISSKGAEHMEGFWF